MGATRLTAAVLLVLALSPALGRAQAPPDALGRAITDPTSVASAPRAPVPPPPIPALFEVRAGAGAAWSADGSSVIVSANTSGRFNLWRYPVDGGAPAILAPSDDRQTGQIALVDGKTVVFESDKAGAERYDLFAVPLAGGPATNLTDTPDISEDSAQASPDGRTLAFERKPKTESANNIAVMDLAGRQVRVLTHEADPAYAWHLVAWTSDGRSLIADRANLLGTRGGVWRIDVASGKAEELTPPAGAGADVLTLASDISPDGRYLAVASNQGGEQTQAALFEIATKRFTWLAPTPWEQVTGSFSPDGRMLAHRTNADGRTSMFLYDVATGAARAVALPPGVNGEGGAGRTAFSPDSRRLLVSHAASNTPPDYWIYDVASGQGRRLTRFAPTSFDAASLPASQLVHYKSADGTVISAFVWVPDGLKRDGSAPGVVLPHGGPTAQTTDVFNRTAIALVTRGYVAIAPNPRGSTGYGKAFQAMNVKDLGGGDLADEVAAARFLAATGYVSPKKIGITGGSYGGYMTLMAIGKTPDLWAAAVEQYGIIDWKTMLQHEDPQLQEYEKSLLGDPVKDAQVYVDDSPITYIRHETAPLLVLQGDNDIRVPKEEAEQVVAILKGEGRTVDAHYYANEGHGFAKRENQIDSLERMISWFDTHLKGAK
jgi:dipeptidyl aminopeptidase/acylaminoacyl peptidase